MRKIFKWTGLAVAGLILLILISGGALYILGGAKMKKTYQIKTVELEIPVDSVSIARGKHLAASRMCMECHGDDLAGKEFIPGGPMGVLPAPNLTSGEGGVGPLTNKQWIRAIRHGIGSNNRGLAIMPSEVFFHMSDEELANLIAYLKQLPAVDRRLPDRSPGLLMHVVANFGKLLPVESIPHETKTASHTGELKQANHGAHLAKLCITCHGEDFTGGIVIGGPKAPPSRNITPHREFGIGSWSKDDFFTALREGKRPTGEILSEAMPRSIGLMSDEELDALWEFLQTVAPISGAEELASK